ncbi:MAG TPA: phosphoribosyltransferase [Mycobacterium sp.]|nr:phosphoribosyltransferase [Mycobacterium sp.]
MIGKSADRTFGDRREAGRALAEELVGHCAGSDVVVLGLARGGVPVGAEIAAALQAPLDVFVVRKLGVPQWPELAMGAIASGGGVVVNEQVICSLRIGDAQLQAVIAAEVEELERRETEYRGATSRPRLTGRTVVLADDGIATGATMLAAVRAVRAARPARVIVAVPVGPPSVDERLCGEADDVVVAVTPRRFDAVGQVYADFTQVSDDEVRAALRT